MSDDRYLSPAEREEISRGLAAGHSLRRIARELGRTPSTISREVERNGGRDGYRAVAAEDAARARARRPKTTKLDADPELREWVSSRLRQAWPPTRIAAALRAEFPDQPAKWLSHETIYQAIRDGTVPSASR
jgi:IS30 family transposase